MRQAANGTCTGAAVAFGGGDSYRIAKSDFMAIGGDGYPNLVPSLNTPAPINTMDERLITYLDATGTISPTIQGRIKCFDANPAVGNNCPVGSP